MIKPMNAPLEPSQDPSEPSLSLDEGELGLAFAKLADCPGFSAKYEVRVSESFKALGERLSASGKVDFGNYDLALQQLEGLRDFLWGGLDPIVRLYMPLEVKGGFELNEKQLEKWLDIACDEQTIKGHKKLIRRALEGTTAAIVRLQELANDMFDPAAQTKCNDEYRDKLRNESLRPMADIGLWKWIEDIQISKNTGKEFHAGYEIYAGPVLIAYHKHVWLPYTEYYADLAAKIRRSRKS
jgi:hypothetical protein